MLKVVARLLQCLAFKQLLMNKVLHLKVHINLDTLSWFELVQFQTSNYLQL